MQWVFKPLQKIAVVKPPKHDIIVKQRFFCCIMVITAPNYIFNKKPEIEKPIIKRANSRWQSTAINPTFCLCVFAGCCSYRRYYFDVSIFACFLSWSTMLLLSQLVSVRGLLFFLKLGYMVLPTHPEGIWKINPHLSDWMYVIWFDKHHSYWDIFFINTWQCALHLRPWEM